MWKKLHELHLVSLSLFVSKECFCRNCHLKRKTEAKLLICQTHGVQLFASWERREMLVAKHINCNVEVSSRIGESEDSQDSEIVR